MPNDESNLPPIRYGADLTKKGKAYARTIYKEPDEAHRAGYELARAQAAELGAHIVAYDVAMKRNAR